MAITTSAGDGVRVTTSAVNETIPAQTNVSDTTLEVEVSDDISTLSNGNLEASPVYVDRMIILRQGLSNEETRRIVSASASGVGNTWILGVNEPWIVDPVGTTDTIHVGYIIQDSATVNGLSLITKRVQDYSSTRRFSVGNSAGGGFAYMTFLDGVSLESVDNSSTTVADFTVEQDGRFDMGYKQAGTPTGGSAIFLTPAVDGELGFSVVSGGEFNMYESNMVSVKRTLWSVGTSTTSKIRILNSQFKFNVNDFLLGAQDSDLNGVSILSDNTGTTPRVRVRDWATGNEVKNIVVNNFDGFESNTSGDDPVLRNTQFINMNKLLTVATGETWIMINPIWNPTTASQADISIAGTGEVLEKFSLDTTSTEIDGTATTAKIYIITADNRGAGTDLLAHELTADANGLANADVETRRLTDNAGTSLTVGTSATFAVISSQYGQLPIIQSFTPANEDQTSENKTFGKKATFTHLADTFQSETTQATAITAGAGITITEQATNPASVIKYTAGTGTLTVGAVVHGDTSGADGTVLEIMEGDSVAGTVLLDTRDGVNYTNGENLSEVGGGADWSATYTASSQKDFDWLIDGNSLGGQVIYDFLNAKLDEATLDVAGGDAMDQVLFWANQGTNALPVVGAILGSPNRFKTVREVNKTAGWLVYNTTLGNWTEFTSNDGTVFTPQASVTINVTTQSTSTGNNIPNVPVSLYDDPVSIGDSPLANGLTNGSGLYSTSLSLSLPFDIQITARLRGLAPFSVISTIETGTATFSVTAPMGTDASVDRRE